MGSISPVAASPAAQVYPLTVDVGFSATVAGKTYDAGVIYTGGQYLAIDGDLTGAEATGQNVQDAEDNLINRIDVMV